MEDAAYESHKIHQRSCHLFGRTSYIFACCGSPITMQVTDGKYFTFIGMSGVTQTDTIVGTFSVELTAGGYQFSNVNLTRSHPPPVATHVAGFGAANYCGPFRRQLRIPGGHGLCDGDYVRAVQRDFRLRWPECTDVRVNAP